MVLWTIFTFIGAVYLAWKFLKWTYRRIAKGIDLEQYKHGSVCITGATDGIGKALAHEFLVRGFKVVLVSRSQAKLEHVCKELQAATGNQQVSVVQCDFSHSHRDPVAFYTALYDKLKTQNISVLVNNVGVAEFKLLGEQNLEKIEEIVGINVYSQTLLTRLLLPDFLTRFEVHKQRSLLIHISSLVAQAYLPGFSVYSSTKKFNEFFSKGVSYECAAAVDSAVVYPAQVTTRLLPSTFPRVPLRVDAATFASGLMRNLKKGDNFGPWQHELTACLASLLPLELVALLVKPIRPLVRRLIKFVG